MNAWSAIRLLLALLLFALSCLAFLQAPTIPLFRLALVVTEFGHWLFLAPLLLALLPTHRSLINLAGTALALSACAMCLSSAWRAQRLASQLPQQMALAFAPLNLKTAAEIAGERAPFTWSRLWFAPKIETVPVEKYEYARRGEQRLSLRFYRSTTRRPAPCIVVIHGGGWEGGSPDEFPALNHHLARRGYAVAAIEYRFAPRWPWPAQRNDVLDAISCLKERAAEFGIDPTQFVVLGRSAGGQIAEAVAYAAHDPAIRGCIAFYAPADMHFAYEFARDDDILSSPRLVRQYLGGTPDKARANYDSASGILLAEPTSPPTLLLHGQRDELVWYKQSARLAAQLRSVGTPHCFVALPWATHAFDFNPNGPGGQLSTYAVDIFLASVTR